MKAVIKGTLDTTYSYPFLHCLLFSKDNLTASSSEPVPCLFATSPSFICSVLFLTPD